VLTVVHLVEHTNMLDRDEETVSRLCILLNILEPLLINDMNLEKALHANVVSLLLSFMQIPTELRDLADEESELKRLRMPIYLK